MKDTLLLTHHLFALFGMLVALVALFGFLVSVVERYKEGFKFTGGDKVSTVGGSLLFNTLRWQHYVVVSRFNSWWGRRNYLVTAPEHLDNVTPGKNYPVLIMRESELKAGWK